MRTAVRAVVVALLAAGPAAADEVAICFNYGCSERAVVRYSPSELGQVQAQFSGADSPAAEREAVARAVAWLYFYAGMQSPIWRDRGGNFDDDDTQPGRMDCIDHSTNTTAYLRLIERHGWLKFHGVGERVLRGRMLADHWAARIVERGSTGRVGRRHLVPRSRAAGHGLPAEGVADDGADAAAGFRDRQAPRSAL